MEVNKVLSVPQKETGHQDTERRLCPALPPTPISMHCCTLEAHGATSLTWEVGFYKTPTFVPQGHSCQMTVPHRNCNSIMFSHSRQHIQVQVEWKLCYYGDNFEFAGINSYVLTTNPRTSLLVHISCNPSWSWHTKSLMTLGLKNMLLAKLATKLRDQ